MNQPESSQPESSPSQPSSARSYPTLRQILLLLLLTAGAIAVHGYHPYVEDGEIYIPPIKRALDPRLYPYNAAFFLSHAHMTFFPELITASIRATWMPVEWALLAWQFVAIFLLLLGCWHLGRLAFPAPLARWGGVALVGALLTIPVAGTALYIMDPYLTPRSLSAPAVIFLVVNTAERKLLRAALWAMFTALIHPLMIVFGISYAAILLWMNRTSRRTPAPAALLLLPFGLFPPVTAAYREVLQTRPYFFLARWHWYEWLGLLAPMALIWWFGRLAREHNLPMLNLFCRAAMVFAWFWLLISMGMTLPPGLARFAELQPMRYLHLLYILLFVFAGGLLAQFVLKTHLWRWLVLFVPLCSALWFVQRRIFPATAHIEWPDSQHTKNDWVRAFLWIRQHTPRDAYFALNPEHMELRGEDEHGFRAGAERSMLADAVKDSGAVAMFPAMAESWREQVQAERGWEGFQTEDFRHLKQEFGVDWVVLDRAQRADLNCPYRNESVRVCRID